jgi:hypothetical protein
VQKGADVVLTEETLDRGLIHDVAPHHGHPVEPSAGDGSGRYLVSHEHNDLRASVDQMADDMGAQEASSAVDHARATSSYGHRLGTLAGAPRILGRTRFVPPR